VNPLVAAILMPLSSGLVIAGAAGVEGRVQRMEGGSGGRGGKGVAVDRGFPVTSGGVGTELEPGKHDPGEEAA
jgi:hypothetical protein